MILIENMLNNITTTFPVVGTLITGTTMSKALSKVADMAVSGEPGYVCFANAHVTVMSRHNLEFREALNNSTFSFPDGMPVFLVGRFLFGHKIQKISGPDFFYHMFADEQFRKLNHYFYGGSEDTLKLLVEELQKKHPDCNIVGTESPPFRQLTDEEQRSALERMKSAKAQLVWVGLGAPKQELWMKKHASQLDSAVLLGVGAAFDFHAGSLHRAPLIMQKMGLEWLYRLLQEPRRLWKRYFVTNSLFLFYVFVDSFKRLLNLKAD